LAYQLLYAVFDKLPLTQVGKTPCQCPADSQALIDLPQQQCPAVTAQPAPTEICGHFTPSQALKLEKLLLTLCHSEVL
jgi:hypothetical protein